MGYTATRKRNFDSNDGIEFVCCRICGDHRRVISGRHLSKHDTDRETYMQEYRLTPDELIAKGFRMLQSSRAGYYPNGKKEWLAAIKKVYEKDGNVFAGYLQDRYGHLYEQASGFSAIGIRLCVQQGLTRKESGVWAEEKIVDTIRFMHQKDLPLYAAYVMDSHPKLFSAARRQFGSWAKTLVAAGVTKKPRTKKLYKGRLSLLNALSDALERHTVKNIPQALKLEAVHYFGSLEKAIAVLRKQRKRLPGWNRRKIMTTLSRMHRSKESLAYARARRDVPALVSAAEAHFGSWGKALYAAGIDPQFVLCASQVAQIES